MAVWVSRCYLANLPQPRNVTNVPAAAMCNSEWYCLFLIFQKVHFPATEAHNWSSLHRNAIFSRCAYTHMYTQHVYLNIELWCMCLYVQNCICADLQSLFVLFWSFCPQVLLSQLTKNFNIFVQNHNVFVQICNVFLCFSARATHKSCRHCRPRIARRP